MRYAPEQIEYAKNRYVNETNRLYQVRKPPVLGYFMRQTCLSLQTPVLLHSMLSACMNAGVDTLE